MSVKKGEFNFYLEKELLKAIKHICIGPLYLMYQHAIGFMLLWEKVLNANDMDYCVEV